MRREKVRGLGYGVVHLADVADNEVSDYTQFGAPFVGVESPVTALCGNRVRTLKGVVVVMGAQSAVTCRHCRRVSA